MRGLVLFISMVVATSALSQKFVEDFMDKLQEVGEKCSEEVGATDDDIAALIAHTIPESHTGKCLVFCFNKAFHLQKEDGSSDLKGSMQSLEPLKADDKEMYDKVLKIFITCGTKVKQDPDPCITAANMGQCAADEGKAMGLSADVFEI
ncbi:unnamed protein product [Brassicogethes aeneus]|uniref:Uncharacterized protein n=1 Tax=Brassicogethes aeneus TaxID=1431903 RepID=A0A9P0BCX1_BRAAE|nr:unnamed protein product [Brassicogethes aeneus]